MSYQLIQGSAHDLPQIPDKSVHLVATSPPYFGLRSYQGDQAIEWPTVEYAPMAGLAPIRIQGCEPGCSHEWADGPIVKQTGGGVKSSTLGPKSGGHGMSHESHVKSLERSRFETTQGAYCIHCGGWRGGLGLEPTIEAYIGHLILCLREWWRILRDDGTVWVNLGDSYSQSGGWSREGGYDTKQATNQGSIRQVARKAPSGLKPKDLMMVPSRFALAAQAEGWTLRSRPPWLKKSAMPESVVDRPSTSHEEWFMLAKNENYFWDIEAVRVPNKVGMSTGESTRTEPQPDNPYRRGTTKASNGANLGLNPSGRNRRTGDWYFESLDIAIDETETWLNHAKQTRKHGGLLLGIDGDPAAFLVNPQPYKEAHFATFPQKMIEPIIRAGTSQHGCCARCGSPYKRVVEKLPTINRTTQNGHGNGELGHYGRFGDGQIETSGWRPTCSCHGHFEEVDDGSDWITEETGMRRKRTVYVPDGPQPDPIPATVLDPFSGSGTTGKACLKLGRKYIGVDISEQYLTELAPERMSNVQMELAL